MLNKNDDKRTQKRPPREEGIHIESSGYFLSLSNKYKKASRIIYLILAASFIITLLFNAKLMTYTNFSYLIRDLNSAAELAEENYNSISYDNDDMRVTEAFRGGVITVSSSDIAIYTATGRRTLYMNEDFLSPKIAISKKYAVAYDLGGNKFSVYNSFAKVYTETLDYPISSVTAADNGWLAVVTKDASHISVVNIYDDDFKLRSSYSFASAYVMFVDINEKCDKLAICKIESGIDKYSTSLLVSELINDKKVFDIPICRGVPYGGSFVEGGAFQLASTDGYFLIDSDDGDILNKYDFNGMNSNRATFEKNGCAISLSDNSGVVNNLILVFDKNGNIVYNTNIADGILDIELSANDLFINHEDKISKTDIKNGNISTTYVSDNGSDIIIYDGNNILLCCKTKAKYIKM